jgi:hypothetical protein
MSLSSPPDDSGRRSPRAPGAIYMSITGILVVMIAALTITATTTPPPAIAELAPQAVQQIKDAPSDQSSALGSAEGGSGLGGLGGGVTTTTAAPPPPPGSPSTTAPRIERARVRRCVGTPPRQIEDPQSPPCVPFWQGDNGGATTRGVTGEEIRVVVGGSQPGVGRLETFFNKRFEFYGRRLRFSGWGDPGATCESNKAAAQGIGQGVKPFAALGLYQANEWCYQEEIARQKVIAITESVFPEQWLAERHPYMWQYPVGVEGMLTGLGQWMCARFAKHNATFADGNDGVALMASQPRKFGLMLQPYGDTYTPDPAPLERELNKCGEKISSTRVFPYAVYTPEDSANAALQMKAAGITTALCLCTAFQTVHLPGQASAQGWYPEWLFTNYGLMDSNFSMKTFWTDAKQRQNVMGLTAEPRQWSYDDTPLIWAFKEADPSFNANAEAASVGMLQWERLYRMLLMLASGIQMAGPNLTPETFAAAMQRTPFPNPDDPLNLGKVGFLKPDHSMTDDFGEFFWSEIAPSPYSDDSVGSVCYVEAGKRRRAGQWKQGDSAFFTPTCDAGAERAPRGDR